ncbi:MAG: hypothetical protein D6709_04035 [Chloroflexi bacterium]|uniref:Dienelactone hydrolase domain-containing protein n=1 Tax=Candidatus Thermofonsia Clade 3 bacterium TaxID=2364212 RepID=A0A2M8QEJ5_9CHLR|nr:MAG: hypothetical protein CUN48_04575 [Candidatus Thermofonsia Clade 3 bacterium]RMG64987.1 MAG: hypothetical protein D6709_04035 [Chloroflexota bacterium]
MWRHPCWRVGRSFALVALSLVALVWPASLARGQPTPPPARAYSFGERTIEQTWRPRRDSARSMPYRVEGIIAIPEGDGPFPLILIFHSAHGGCPPDAPITELELERWPCKPSEERRNDAGFAYLARALAARGYVAVAPNLNAVYAAAYGSVGPELRRYPPVLEAHLSHLVAANRRRTEPFGVSLVGKLDLSRIGILAHGHGALLAMQSARARQGRPRAGSADANGPLAAVLLVAPLYSSEGDADVPLGVILPACDGMAPDLHGQGYYEDARLARNRKHFAASVYLLGATHNAFNEVAPQNEPLTPSPVAGCPAGNARLSPQRQRDFLARYAPDFFDASMQAPRSASNGAPASRAGLNPLDPAPISLYDLPVRTALALGAVQRAIVVQPRTRDDLGFNDFGGYALRGNASHLDFCEYRQPCMRWAIQPGNPSQVRFSWTNPAGAKWILPLGEAPANLSAFSTLHLRVALDPTDYLNAHREPVTLTLTLTDAAGRSASTQLDGATPSALAHSAGEVNRHAWGWIGHAYLASVRVRLTQFTGVDLTRVQTLEISVAGERSGSVLLADIEFLRVTPAQRSARLDTHHAPTPQPRR